METLTDDGIIEKVYTQDTYDIYEPISSYKPELLHIYSKLSEKSQIDFIEMNNSIFYASESSIYVISTDDLTPREIFRNHDDFFTEVNFFADQNKNPDILFFSIYERDRSGKIYSYNTKEGTLLKTTDCFSNQIYVESDYIYFSQNDDSTANSGIYSLKIQGNVKNQLITDNVAAFYKTDNIIFYTNYNNELYKFDITNNQKTFLCEGIFAQDIIYKDGFIYSFTNELGAIKLFNLETLKKYSLPDLNPNDVAFGDDKIYYILDEYEGVYTIPYGGGYSNKIRDDFSYWIDIKNNKLYLSDGRMDLDGSNYKEFLHFQP